MKKYVIKFEDGTYYNSCNEMGIVTALNDGAKSFEIEIASEICGILNIANGSLHFNGLAEIEQIPA